MDRESELQLCTDSVHADNRELDRISRWPVSPRSVFDGAAHKRRPRFGRTVILTSNAKRRLAAGVAAALAAAVGSVTLAIHGASAGSDPTVPEGINVPAISTGASTALIASLEGRNEATAGSDNGQALELIGIQGNTLTYSIAWRALGAPTQATIHAGTRGADGPVVVTLFATPPSTDDVASGTVTVDDPTLLAALRSNPSDFYAEMTTKKSPDGAVRAQRLFTGIAPTPA